MLKTLRRMNLGGWPCLLALSLHLLAPLSQAAHHLPHTYDDANNRATKTVTRISGTSSTEAGENDIGHWSYDYNEANQLVAWEKWDAPAGTQQKTATLTYDDAGNRTSQSVTTWNLEPETSNTGYTWDAQDRLASVTMPNGSTHSYEYDYRTRRIGTGARTPTSANETRTAIIFSGGLSVAEYETTVPLSSPVSPLPSSSPTVEYTRGPDMGGGVGGLLYSQRTSPSSSTPTLRYSLSNGRGDIVAQADSAATLTWTASYEAYGKRTKETGTNEDKQRANSKDEDPTGLLNEGFRYRDIETGVWLSRDPAGFVDGPNLYCFVVQNPWTKWDPDGLSWREWASAVADFVPGVSTIKSAVEVVTGKDLITGESVSRAEATAGLGASFIPGGKGALKAAKVACQLADKTFEINGKADAVMAIASDVAEGNVNLSTLQQAASLRGGGKKERSETKGGAHRDTTKPSGDGLESHHMPADSINGIPTNDGPAIKMEHADHAETSSWGSGRDAEVYREGIKKKIDSGDMRGAMADEIRDVRRAAQQVSGDRTKYNSAMREMMKYAREKKIIPKNPQNKVERTK